MRRQMVTTMYNKIKYLLTHSADLAVSIDLASLMFKTLSFTLETKSFVWLGHKFHLYN